MIYPTILINSAAQIPRCAKSPTLSYNVFPNVAHLYSLAPNFVLVSCDDQQMIPPLQGWVGTAFFVHRALQYANWCRYFVGKTRCRGFVIRLRTTQFLLRFLITVDCSKSQNLRSVAFLILSKRFNLILQPTTYNVPPKTYHLFKSLQNFLQTHFAEEFC